jgi:hypothetical protein
MVQKIVDRMVLGTVAFFYSFAVTVLRRFKRA